MRMLPLPLLLTLPFNSQTFLRWLNFNLPQVLKMICKMQKFHVINSCPASEPTSRPKHRQPKKLKLLKFIVVKYAKSCINLRIAIQINSHILLALSPTVAGAAPINCNIKQLQMEPSEKLINGQARHTNSDICTYIHTRLSTQFKSH